ncbi:hypothetical protein ACJX0J_023138 [Zea mays]
MVVGNDGEEEGANHIAMIDLLEEIFMWFWFLEKSIKASTLNLQAFGLVVWGIKGSCPVIVPHISIAEFAHNGSATLCGKYPLIGAHLPLLFLVNHLFKLDFSSTCQGMYTFGLFIVHVYWFFGVSFFLLPRTVIGAVLYSVHYMWFLIIKIIKT